MSDFKPCKVCGLLKNLTDFHKSANRDGRFNICKSCHHIRTILWRKSNHSKTLIYNRTSRLRSRYNLSNEQFVKFVEAQKGACLICGDIPDPKGSNRTNKLHVDHCHITGKVRGLLCHLCNRGIGLFRERQDLLEKALEYLHSHN